MRFIVAKTAAVAGATDIPATSFAISGSNTTQETGTLALDTVTTVPPVGSPSQGGKVACTTPELMTPTTFYLVATVYESIAVWGSMGVATGATDDTNGYSNTQAIMDHGGGSGDTAAHICTSIQVQAEGLPCSVGGVCYEDWYVPAKNELSCLYNNKDAIPGMSDSNYSDYWSSTEVDENSAYILDFSTNSFQAVPKNSHHIIFRCVRSVSN